MSVTLELTDDLEAQIKREADRKHMPVEEYITRILKTAVPFRDVKASAEFYAQPPAERARLFVEWVNSHTYDGPVPPPEAYDRENLYEDRV